jgi:hypothetical protein
MVLGIQGRPYVFRGRFGFGFLLGTFQMLVIVPAVGETIADIEDASVWLEGDPDVFGAGKPIQGVASQIVAILTENESE